MKEDYDFAAVIYDPLLFLALNRVRLLVAKELSAYKNKKILDLCCGTGSQLKMLAKKGFTDLHGLDISDSMLKVAEKSDCQMKIYNGDATQTNFKDEYFDLIILSFAIHEKDRDTQKKLLDEAYRVLKKEGMILIVDFIFDTQTSLFSKTIIRTIEWMAGKTHYRNFKNYIHAKGLPGVMQEKQFRLKKDTRKLLNGVTVSTYSKIT